MLARPVRSGPHYLLSVLSAKCPLMDPIAPKPLRLFLRRRDGHLIAEVDRHLPIGLIRPVFCDRTRSPWIELDLLHRPIMHLSWGIPGQAAS